MRKRMISIAPLLALFAGLDAIFRNDTVADQLKNLAEQHQKAWNDFKVENDKRLAEIEKNGKESATTRQNVENLNKKLDELNDSIKNAQKSADDRADKLETKVNRIGIGGAAGTPEQVAAKNRSLKVFNQYTKKNNTMEQFDAYSNALNEYLRVGDENKLASEVRNALSAGYEQGGGYFVPNPETGPTKSKVFETSPMRQLATVVTLTTANALEGLVDNDEATTGWVSETGTRSETNTPQVGKYRIELFEQYAEPRITQQLLDDAAFDVAGWLDAKVDNKLGRTENTAFVTGNNSGKPRGFLDYSKVVTADATRAWDAIQYIASGASGAFAASSPADPILDMIYALKNAYRAGASFFAARATYGAARKLKDGQGNYLAGSRFADGAFQQTLFGFPAAEGEDMPALAANSFSLAFGNFKEAYTIVERPGKKVLVDPYTAKPYVKYYTTKRVGGGLVNGEAVKLMKFA